MGLEADAHGQLDIKVDERFQASVEALPDALVVTQSQRIHREVVDLLEQLDRHNRRSMTSSAASAAINEHLEQPVRLEFVETPLRDALTTIAELYGANFVLDAAALSTAGIDGDEKISADISGITLRSALKILLADVGGVELTSVMEDEVIKVTTPDGASSRRTETEASAAAANAAHDAGIRGVIRVEGVVPSLPPLIVAGDPAVRDAAILDDDVEDESLVVGDMNGLANVFVWLRVVPAGVPIPSPSSEPIKIESRGLRYVPRCLLARTQQPILLTNADPVVANARSQPFKNTPINMVLSPNDLVGVPIAFVRPEQQPVAMTDDFHPTRRGYVLAIDHPYAAVTDSTGRFDMPPLPPGEYELTLWHERAGYLERGLQITVPGDEQLDLDLSFEADRFIQP